MNLKISIIVMISHFIMACNPVDLRPPANRSDNPTQVDKDKGKLLYDQALTAMGGYKEFSQYKKVSVSFTDTWNSVFQRWMAMPWPDNNTKLLMNLYPFNRTPEVYFTSPNDSLLGYKIYNSEVYYIYKSEIINEGSDNMRFWLLSLENFFLMPFNLRKDTLISYGGEGTAFGNVYDLVYITWKSFKTQKNIDQYLLWINRKTSLVDMMQYTIREKLSVLYGTLHYSDYKKVGKLLLPHKHELLQDPESPRPIRVIKIDKFELSN